MEKVGIIKPYTGDPYYGELGTAAMKAIELDILGTLDESSVSEAIKPRLEGWRKFDLDYAKNTASYITELQVTNGLWAGRLDLFGCITNAGKCLIDVKCTEKVNEYATNVQTALYEACLEWPVAHRYALQLTKKGDYALIPLLGDFKPIVEAVWALYRVKIGETV